VNPGEPSWADINTSLAFVLQALENIHTVWMEDSALALEAARRLDPEYPRRGQWPDTERVDEIRNIIVRIEWLLEEMYDADHPPST
jgi:hypothetical protein